tara:strand:+ start:85 stop:372 length:288 start_codon:yes stop_codon:yes gene_type:complete
MIEPLCERTDLDHYHPDHDIIDKTIGPNPNRPKRNILIYADGQTVGLEKIIIILNPEKYLVSPNNSNRHHGSEYHIVKHGHGIIAEQQGHAVINN